MNAKKAKQLRRELNLRRIAKAEGDTLQTPMFVEKFPLLTKGGAVKWFNAVVPRTATHADGSVRQLYKQLKSKLQGE